MKKYILFFVLLLGTVLSIYFINNISLENEISIAPDENKELENENLENYIKEDKDEEVIINEIKDKSETKTEATEDDSKAESESNDEINSEKNTDDKLSETVKKDVVKEPTVENESNIEVIKEEDKVVENEDLSVINDVENNEIEIESETNKNEEDTVFSFEKMDDVQNEISLGDKAKAVKLILTRLSFDDIMYLKKLANGGLTTEERVEAKEFALSRFTEEEVIIIDELYERYLK